MTDLPLLSMATISAVAAVVFLLAARVLGKRPVTGEANLANLAFRGWWFFLALSTLLGTVLRDLLVVIDRVSLPLMVAIEYGYIALLCVALAGLLYYLVYLYTGRWGAWKPIVGFYVLYFILLVSMVTQAHPQAVIVEQGLVRIRYALPLEDHPLYLPVILLLVGPQIVASLGYLLLLPHVEGPTVRYRVVLVSLSILVWFGSALVAALTGLSDLAYWPLVSRVLGLLAALVVLVAYQPPGFVRRWLQVRAVADEVRPEPEDSADRTWSEDVGPGVPVAIGGGAVVAT